ncbi:hypothetical protein L873DRAFT_1934126, partial [Choiromyces venosus 120613-1]
DKERLTIARLSQYIKVVKCITGLLGIWGFVDRMMRPFCYLSKNQCTFYSGYQKNPCI